MCILELPTLGPCAEHGWVTQALSAMSCARHSILMHERMMAMLR